MKPLAIGGVEDHVHVLLSLPSTLHIAKARTVDQRWVVEVGPRHVCRDRRDFAWQEGYGAFSIGISQVDDTIAYIDRQAEHHRRRSYQEEFLAILQKHRIEYDPRYLWD